jgi:hypothetical protein
MRALAPLALALGLLLAGCAGSPEPTDGTRTDAARPTDLPPTSAVPPPPGPAGASDVRGVVLEPGLRPIAGAAVRLVGEEFTTSTDAQGRFAFTSVPEGAVSLQAHAPGYLVANATVLPERRLDVRIVLEPAPIELQGYNRTLHFEGIIRCAAETLIITPSCDSALIVVPPEDRPFEQNYSFAYGVDLDWRTQVIDVVFDPAAQPAFDGLRIVLRGIRDDVAGFGNYTQYGRWHDAQPFTVRVEPGGNYTDGDGPVPGDYTGWQIDVYPHGKAYHTVCDPRPDGEGCFLGVGAGIDVEFDLYVTTFYGEAAPEGFTKRTA